MDGSGFPFGLRSEDGGVEVKPRFDALTGAALPASGVVTRRVPGSNVFYCMEAQSARMVTAERKAELDEAAREAAQQYLLDKSTKAKTVKRKTAKAEEGSPDVNERSGGKGGTPPDGE